MNFIIDKNIFDQHPDLKIGLILLKGINNSRRVSAVESLLRGISAQRRREVSSQDITEMPKVAVWNRAYGRFGINPIKFHPKLVSNIKKIQVGEEIPHVNTLEDIANYFSLKYLLPIKGEDLDWLCGDLRLAFTQGKEPFRAIDSIQVNRAHEGEIAYMDNGGITSRYWNHQFCERTKLKSKTVNAALFIEDLSNIHMDEFGRILNEIQMSLVKYIGGQIEIHILNEENLSADLKVEGRKVIIDDGKVPRQEKAHFIEEKMKNEQMLPINLETENK